MKNLSPLYHYHQKQVYEDYLRLKKETKVEMIEKRRWLIGAEERGEREERKREGI
jgi:hypothetical protein